MAHIGIVISTSIVDYGPKSHERRPLVVAQSHTTKEGQDDEPFSPIFVKKRTKMQAGQEAGKLSVG